MKRTRFSEYVGRALVIAALVSVTSSCGNGGDESLIEYSLHGVVQKGPMSPQTLGRALPLDERLVASGHDATAAITALDQYSLSIKTAAPYVEITFSGAFFDELAGADGQESVTLRMFAPVQLLKSAPQINVNVLTTLAAARTRALLQAGTARDDAVSRAEDDVNGLFFLASMACNARPFHALTETSSSPGSAYLLRATLVLLRARTILGVPLQQLLDRLTGDFAADGQLDDAALRSVLADADASLDYDAARSHLTQRYATGGRSIETATATACAKASPIAAALSDRTLVVGTTARFDASSSVDPAGETLTFAWHLTREQSDRPYFNPPPYDSQTASGPTFEFTANREGSWRLELAVSDRFGSASRSTARIVARSEFRDNGDGTATNSRTGATWQVQDDGGLYTLAEARGRPVLSAGDNHGLDVCGTLVLAGYDDWRVPTLPEVQSLEDFTRTVMPFSDPFPVSTRADAFYISDSWIPNSKVDYVYSRDGLIYHLDASERAYLRCIRP